MAAPVELFSTSILSNHRIRQRHERYVSVLTVKKVPFVYHDLASDEDAKKRWRGVAKDASIPGLLVHNEWRGTFEEFEEAVEFGELEIFLRIDAKRAEREAAAFAAQYPEAIAAKEEEDKLLAEAGSKTATAQEPAPKHAPVVGLAQPRLVSHSSKIAAAPSAPLPMAPKGTGGRRELNTEAFLESLGLDDLKLSEEELREILEEGAREEEEEEKAKKISSTAPEPAAPAPSEPELTQGGRKRYPDVLGKGMATTSASKPVPRTYTPSAEAGIKPLRLAKMGKDPLAPRSATSPLSTRANGVNDAPSSPPPLPKGAAQVTARYNTAQLSSKALAAEAAASVSKRALSGTTLRSAVASGETLEQALDKARVPSASESVVGREDPDELLKSLGLADLKLTDEEAEAFLLDGTIPDGATEGGVRLGRRGSSADRAREETAAREVAKRAREKGYGTPTERRSTDSARSGGGVVAAHSRAASVAGSLAGVEEGEDDGGADAKDKKENGKTGEQEEEQEEDQPTIDASPSAKEALDAFPSPPTSPPLVPSKNAKRTSSSGSAASGAATAAGAAGSSSSPPVRPARSHSRVSSGSIPSLAALTSTKPPPAEGGQGSVQESEEVAAIDETKLAEEDAKKGQGELLSVDQEGGATVVDDDGATPQMGTRTLPSDSSLAAKAAGAGFETPKDAKADDMGATAADHASSLAVQLGMAQSRADGQAVSASDSQRSALGLQQQASSGDKPPSLDLSLEGARPSTSDVVPISTSPGAGLVTSPSIELSEAEALPEAAVGDGAGLASAQSSTSLAASSLSSSSSLSIPNSAAASVSSPPSGPAKTPRSASTSSSGVAGGRTSSASASRSPSTPSRRRTGMDYQRREPSTSSSSFNRSPRDSASNGNRPPPLSLSPSATSHTSSNGGSGGGPTTPGSAGKKSRFGSMAKALSGGGNKDKDAPPGATSSEKRSPLPSFGRSKKSASASTTTRTTTGEERRAKTLSQILREADAAMMADDFGGGEGEGGDGEEEDEEEPDDGMGRLPEEEEGGELEV